MSELLISIEDLLSKTQEKTNQAQRTFIKKAYLLAHDAHKLQKRLSGEPYISHPLSVASILVDLDQDHETIAAALLHDVLEDTDISHEHIVEKFGESVAHLVEGVTKISKLKKLPKKQQQDSSIRKMILATVKDVRVIIIKLADKLHNMRTLKFHREEKAKNIAKEVIDIYAPLAGRLGIYRLKWELEDLALSAIDPNAYNKIKSFVSEKRSKREERVEELVTEVEEELKTHKIQANVLGRSKHFYSVYRKMMEQNKSIENIFDLSGLRVLVSNVKDCYATLGIIHTIWSPIPGRFKDYIATPKSNGYQSLHTSVLGPDGSINEVQIRTKKMHKIAEFGVAAHWSYKEKDKTQNLSEQYQLLQSIAQFQKNEDIGDFMEELRSNLSTDEVYVFTPKGEIFTMVKGATVLDFAFRIHTDLGLHCAGGKVKNRLISIRTPLTSGDQIQILTNSNVLPSRNWLNFLKTSHARSKLKAWLRRNDLNIQSPPPPIAVKKSKEETPETTDSKLPLKPSKGRMVEWEGEFNFSIRFAQCCTPVPNEAISGFITRGNGVSVHKSNCSTFEVLKLNEETASKIINLRWTGLLEPFPVRIKAKAKDRPNLFLDIVKNLASAGANILEVHAMTRKKDVRNVFTIEVDSLEHLEQILDNLKSLPGVKNVSRFLGNLPNNKNEES